MNQDINMARIATNFTWKDDNFAWPRPQSGWGISAERWDEYRSVFRSAGIAYGTNRKERSSDVMLLVWTWGLVTDGSYVFYVHCGSPGKVSQLQSFLVWNARTRVPVATIISFTATENSQAIGTFTAKFGELGRPTPLLLSVHVTSRRPRRSGQELPSCSPSTTGR
jgi:hypothetical protein